MSKSIPKPTPILNPSLSQYQNQCSKSIHRFQYRNLSRNQPVSPIPDPHRDLSFLVFECMISFSLSNENHAFKKQENLLLRFCTALMGMIGQFFQDNKPLNGYIFEYFFIILSKNILFTFLLKQSLLYLHPLKK